MKTKKINPISLLFILISALVLPLAGCSLAVKDAGSDLPDMLIGVLITADPLDTFDMDAYLDDHAHKLVSQKNLTVDSDGYENPLYAVTDRHNSKDASDWDVDFKGIDGLKFFAPSQKDKERTSRFTKQSDGICDARMDLMETDQGHELNLSATVYTTPTAAEEERIFHINRVYQTAAGKIYAASGNGLSLSAGTERSEGERMSTSVDHQTEYREKQKTMTDKTSVTIHFAITYEPVNVTLCQMDDENRVIKQEDFAPGKLPIELTAEKDTAYILVKTEKKTPDGDRVFSREICERGYDGENGSFETSFILDNGIVSKQQTEVIWEK